MLMTIGIPTGDAAVINRPLTKMLLVLVVGFLVPISEAFDFFQRDYEMVFERVELASYSKEFFEDMKAVTWKYNRTQPVVNSTFIIKVDFQDNLEIVVQGYKFLSNEYREFPMRFQFNLCQGLKDNLFGIARVYDIGQFPKCPMKKGNYYFSKWAPDQSKFPPNFPDGKYMWTFEAMYFKRIGFTLKGYAEIARPIIAKN